MALMQAVSVSFVQHHPTPERLQTAVTGAMGAWGEGRPAGWHGWLSNLIPALSQLLYFLCTPYPVYKIESTTFASCHNLDVLLAAHSSVFLKTGHLLEESFKAITTPTSANAKLKRRHLPLLFSSNFFILALLWSADSFYKLRRCCLKLQCPANHLPQTYSKLPGGLASSLSLPSQIAVSAVFF